MHYCKGCNKPLFYHYNYCSVCNMDLKMAGGEYKRVKFGSIGRATIPIQQSLHRRFFGCNAPIKYRGPLASRIYVKIEPEVIQRESKKLHNYLLSMDNIHGKIYKKIKDTRNISTRILYNSTLFYLHYIYPNKFNGTLLLSKDHLDASLAQHIYRHIENIYLRTIEPEKNTSIPNNNRVLSVAKKNRMSYSWKSISSLASEVEDRVGVILSSLRFT